MKFYPPHYLLILSLCMLVTWYFGKSSPQTLPLILVGLGLIGLGFLDQFQIGGFKLGFWFAQQGSIYFFVLLIFIYIYLMNKLDKKYEDKSGKDN